MMESRKTLIVGNWKMHLNVSQSSHLSAFIHKHVVAHRDIEVVLAPSFLALQPLSLEIDRRRFRLAAQNANAKDEGALTGEVSFSMLRNLVHYVIVGHSTRRIYFNESLDTVRDKVSAAIRNQISPILCIGETADERNAGEARQVVHDQLTSALSDLTKEEVKSVVVAYEPVWALSNFGGKLAKPDQVHEQVKFIRHQIRELYGPEAEKEVRVLYGGSVDAHIASGYLEVPGCDGCLVGNASLNFHSFCGIVDAAYKLNRKKSE